MVQMTAHLSFLCCDYPGDLVRPIMPIVVLYDACVV